MFEFTVFNKHNISQKENMRVFESFILFNWLADENGQKYKSIHEQNATMLCSNTTKLCLEFGFAV